MQNELPGTFTAQLEVRTGSGGVHLYFECLSPTPCRANIRPGIDIKADGGYVVAPSSRHVSRARYRFVSNGGLVPPPLPAALRDLIFGNAQAHVASAEEPPKFDLDCLRVSAEIKKQIRAGVPKGKRSEAIFAAVRAMVKAGHSDEEILTVLMDRAYGLSEKPCEMGEAWLRGELKRAREKPDRDSRAPSSPKANGGILISRRASEIPPEAINWLWPQRIALGKLSLIAGQPGSGKSQVATYTAAIVSSGGTWPTGEACQPSDVLFLSAEDDPADTIRPRLEACGANLDRVHIVEAVRDQRSERPFDLNRDIEALAAGLAMHPSVKLIDIDPISAYLGRTNSHNNAEVRATLAPLAKLAVDHRVAIVAVTHLNKSLTPDPLTRVMGSTAFIAAVRSAHLVEKDKVNPERRLLLPLKSNISQGGLGLAFRLVTHVFPSGIETSRVVWEPKPVMITASEALTPSTPEDIGDTKEMIAASVKIFDGEKVQELRSSTLIQLLQQKEQIEVSPKRFKSLMQSCGIRQHRRSDANYYRRADFAAASTSIPPSLHSSILPSSSMQQERKFDSKEGVEAVERVEGVEPVEGGGTAHDTNRA